MSPTPTEHTGQSAPTVESLQSELAAVRAERDRAIAARDALIREVLPGVRRTQEPRQPRRSALGAVVAIAVVGLFAALLLQNWRALRALGSDPARSTEETSRASVMDRRPPGIQPRPALPSERSPEPVAARWEAIPVVELSSLGRAALAPSGDRLAIAEAAPGRRVVMLALPSGRRLWTSGQHAAPVRDLAFLPDGSGLVTGGADGSVLMWQAASGRLQRRLRQRGRPVWALAISSNGLLAMGGEGSDVELQPLQGGQGRKLAGHRGWVRALAFSAAGDLLASGGHDGQVLLWDLKGEGAEPRPLSASSADPRAPAHRLWVSALTFSSDGKLASAGWDGRLQLWDAAGGKLLRALRGGHVRTITALAFDAGGKQLASASLDRTVALWNLQTGRAVPLQGHRWAVSSVAFTPGGRLLSVSGDGTVRSWPLPLALPPGATPLPPARPGELTLRNNTTGERLRLRLFDGDRLLPAAAKRIAAFLRCGADDQAGQLDERLLRLLDRIAEQFGRNREILVISGYRSPQYNNLRTKQSRGVAKESQHLQGTAIDLRVSGVTITKLREVVSRWRVGGVGFYPDSHFVHVDVGPVRSWSGD